MARSSEGPLEVVLVSTYELGRQPFGLASPAAWLIRAGAQVRCIDLSRDRFVPADYREADFIGFYLPMHTATRLAAPIIPKVREINPAAHLCAFGLYAPVNDAYLRGLGIQSVIGGEFEEELSALVSEIAAGENSQRTLPIVSLRKQDFLVPDRTSLPALSRYSRLVLPDGSERVTGYTEASRGCKHLCRHCPIVPVYGGRFRVIGRDVVLEDIRRQVAVGAQHITFGDPDFFNGIGHAAPLVRALHAEFPDVTYDVTIKIEHLLKHADRLEELTDTGCAFVTSAVESLDDVTLALLDKGHTRADFVRVAHLCRDARLPLIPTFVTFTPWLTPEAYGDLLTTISSLGLVDTVAPVQWTIRLLIPHGSRLLELDEVKCVTTGFDETALTYTWAHPDPRLDQFHGCVERFVRGATERHTSRSDVFQGVWNLLVEHFPEVSSAAPRLPEFAARCTVPYLTEPWFC